MKPKIKVSFFDELCNKMFFEAQNKIQQIPAI